jgi:hypothetical protein
MPRHVAIVMDGNRRRARKVGLQGPSPCIGVIRRRCPRARDPCGHDETRFRSGSGPRSRAFGPGFGLPHGASRAHTQVGWGDNPVSSGYPPVVQRRISGSGGHLSNRAAAALLVELYHPALAGLGFVGNGEGRSKVSARGGKSTAPVALPSPYLGNGNPKPGWMVESMMRVSGPPPVRR